jgi:hypothetical protein
MGPLHSYQRKHAAPQFTTVVLGHGNGDFENTTDSACPLTKPHDQRSINGINNPLAILRPFQTPMNIRSNPLVARFL